MLSTACLAAPADELEEYRDRVAIEGPDARTSIQKPSFNFKKGSKRHYKGG